MDVKNVMIAVLLTMLWGAFGLCFYLRYELGKARGESFSRKFDQTLHGILDVLEDKMGFYVRDGNGETLSEQRRRYMDSEIV